MHQAGTTKILTGAYLDLTATYFLSDIITLTRSTILSCWKETPCMNTGP